MDSRTLVERVMKNLSFQVEAIPTSNKLDPMNVTVKVRKKEINEQYNRGFISNNQSEPEKLLQNIRFVSSQDTIMSFDMFMEEEGKNNIHIEQKRKPRKRIFHRLRPGICLGTTTDDDDQPYMPDKHSVNVSKDSWVSKSDGKLREQYGSSRKKTVRTFLGKKCKPGGCLDPPFSEDNYSYRPVVQEPVVDVSSNTGIVNSENKAEDIKSNVKSTDNNEMKSKFAPICINTVNDKVQKSDSVVNIYMKDPKRNSDKTCPPDDKNKEIRSNFDGKDKSRQSMNDSINTFFIPPKGIKRESNNYVQRDPSNRHSYSPHYLKDKPTENFPLPSAIAGFSSSVPAESNSASKIIHDINLGDMRNAEIQALPNSKQTEQKQKEPLAIPIQVYKEPTKNNDDYVEFSSRMGDIKRISFTSMNNSPYCPNIDEDVSFNDVDNHSLPITNDDISRKMTKENEMKSKESEVDGNQNRNEKDQVTTNKRNLSDMNINNIDKEVSRTSFESVVDQVTKCIEIETKTETEIKSNLLQPNIREPHELQSIIEPYKVQNRIEKPNEVQSMMARFVEVHKTIQKNHEVQNIIEKPDEVQNKIEKPDEVQDVTEKSDEEQNVIEKPDEVLNIIEKPDELQNIIEKPDEVQHVTEKPDEAQNIIEKPDEVLNIIEKPDEVLNLIDKPDEVQYITEKPDVEQNIIEKPDKVQNTIEKPDEGQHIIDKPDEVQNILEKSDEVQNILEKSDEVQNIFTSSGFSIEKPDEVKNIREKPDEVQNIIEKPDEVQNILEKSDEVQNIIEKPDEVENIREKPDEVQNIIRKPDEVQGNKEKSDEVKNIREKPDEVQNIIEKPDEVQNILEKSDEVQNIIEKPDEVENIREKPDEVQNIIRKPDEVQGNKEKSDEVQNIIVKRDEVEVIKEKPDEIEDIIKQPDEVQNIIRKPDEVQNIIEQPDEVRNIMNEYDEVQNKNRDSQISKVFEKAMAIPDYVNEYANLDNADRLLIPIQEISSISDDKPQLESNLSETFKHTEDENMKNMDSNMMDMNDNENISNITDRGVQQTNDSKRIKEIDEQLPNKQIVNSQDGTNDTLHKSSKSGTKKNMVIDLDIQRQNMTVNGDDSSIEPAILLVPTSIIEPETTSPAISTIKSEASPPLSDDLVTTDLRTVSLKLAFHSYLTNKHERIFKTITEEREVNRCPNDSVTIINSQIKASLQENYPELIIPIDSSLDMMIKIKNNKSQSYTVSDKFKTMPVSNIAKTSNNTAKLKSSDQKVHYQVNQNDIGLDTTLKDIYEQELIPLQKVIRDLKAQVDVLAEQQILNKKNVICLKKSPRPYTC